MVYHHPAEEPWVNTRPVLRLLFSDSAASSYFRFIPAVVCTAAASCVGSAVLLRYLCSDSPSLATRLLPTTTKSVIGVFCAAGVGTLAFSMARQWSSQLQPLTEIPQDYTFFREVDDETAKAESEATHPGVALAKSRGEFTIDSPACVETVMERGFNTVGMSFIDYVVMHCTLGVEYALTSWVRNFCHGFGGVLGWYEPVSATSRHRLYKAVLNSSLACFTRTHSGDIDPDLQLDVGGHVVLCNVRLPLGDNAHRTFRKVVFFVNHTAWELEKVVLVHRRESGKVGAPDVTTWGSRAHDENTDCERISEQESLHQAGLLLIASVAFHTHVVIHWWSTAVASLSKNHWADGAAESTRMTQWVNTQAVLASHCFIGNSSGIMADILTFNAQNPFPMHGVSPPQSELTGSGSSDPHPIMIASASDDGTVREQPLFSVIGERSTFHQMSAAAGAALKQYFNGTMSDMAIRGIVVASVQHSMEHFLVAQLTPIFSDHAQCVALRMDLSGLFHCLVAPGFYVTRPFLSCWLRFWDPVSQTIYRACACREAELVAANAAAKANGVIEPYVPLKNYCKHYLHIGCSV